MPEPYLRASDADRAAVAAVLGEHMSAGRLTLAEYDERVGRAYAARTYGELDELTTDLPSPRPRYLSQPVPQPAPVHSGGCGPAWGGSYSRAIWAPWLTTALIVVTIWLITSVGSGGGLYFWPIWVIGPWGAMLLARTLGGRRPGPHDHRRQRA